MKILFISMNSVHAIRWIENLNDTDHECYWFDILDRGNLYVVNPIKQYTGWSKRKLPYIKGEFFLSKRTPILYSKIRPFLEITENEVLDKIIQEIRPNVVHSFEMQSCSYPIIKTMNKYLHIKWIYSCWGNDLFYYKNIPFDLNQIQKVLKRVDFIHADCARDLFIAKELGFEGVNLGVIPTGGGYEIKKLKEFRLPIEERKIILVKGYQHVFGRAINIIKALESIQKEVQNFEVIVFGAHQSIVDYVNKKNLSFKIYNRSELQHEEVLYLMGKSLLYIGNNISDGIPNTLLEAIVMGAFPIQSNPGGATAEIIIDGENGFLIENPEDVNDIANLILKAFYTPELIKEASANNQLVAINKLDYTKNKQKIIALYQKL